MPEAKDLMPPVHQTNGAPAKPAPQQLPYLDGWRGLSIVMVLLGHFAPIPGVNAGRLGVELFFALSGTLIGGILFVKQEPLQAFAIKRFSRIVPSMWVLCLTVFVISAAFEKSGGIRIWPGLLGLANVAAMDHRLEHLWSVAVELQTYALLFSVAWACRRYDLKPPRVLAIVLATSWLLIFAAAIGGADEYYSTYWKTPYRLTAMVAGAALASYGTRRTAFHLPAPLCLLVGAGLQMQAVPDFIKYTVGSLLLAIACAGLQFSGISRKILSNRALGLFGGASFSIYLWQQLLYEKKAVYGGLLCLVGAIAVGFAAHLLWDHRLHEWTRRKLLAAASGKQRKQIPAA